MYPERIATSQRLPQEGETVILYSENTGVHRGYHTASGLWVDMFGAIVSRVTYWWHLNVPGPGANGGSHGDEGGELANGAH